MLVHFGPKLGIAGLLWFLVSLPALGCVANPRVGSAATQLSSDRCEIRLATYNVAAGTGLMKLEWERKLNGLVSTIVSSGAGIVLIQELDQASERSQGRDVLAELRRRLEASTGQPWTTAFAPSCSLPGVNGGEGFYGNGILSRWPIVNVQRRVIDNPAADPAAVLPCRGEREPRSLLLAETGGLAVVAAHVASDSSHDWADEVRAFTGDAPVVVGVDLNAGDDVAAEIVGRMATALGDGECSGASGPQCSPATPLEDTRSAHAYDDARTERDPTGQFDYVFVLRRRASTVVETARVVASSGASDHDLVVLGLSETVCPPQLASTN